MGDLRRALAAAAATMLLAGCGGSSGGSAPAPPPIPFDQPEVALRDVHVRGIGLTGGSVDVTLRVYNPNDYDLTAPRVGYRVLVGDALVARGLMDLDVVVPSHDSATVRIPASFGYGALGRAGREMLDTGSAPYRVLGRITVGTPYGRLSFPYDRVGNFAPLGAALSR